VHRKRTLITRTHFAIDSQASVIRQFHLGSQQFPQTARTRRWSINRPFDNHRNNSRRPPLWRGSHFPKKRPSVSRVRRRSTRGHRPNPADVADHLCSGLAIRAMRLSWNRNHWKTSPTSPIIRAPALPSVRFAYPGIATTGRPPSLHRPCARADPSEQNPRSNAPLPRADLDHRQREGPYTVVQYARRYHSIRETEREHT